MKKYLLLTFAGVIFATVNTFAHCGSCGVGDEKAHEHAAKCAEACTMACSKGEAKCGCGEKCTMADMSKKCKDGCDKPCCAKKAECKDDCDKPCCAKKAECKDDCDKPCCAKPKMSEEAEPTASAAPSCCAAKVGAPA